MIKKLNNYVNTEFVLVFQYDGFILGADNWREEFLNYDYIGCPWIGYFSENPDHNIGNGGFSLRSKKLLEILVNDEKIKLGESEDSLICRQYREYLEQRGIKFAPEEIAGNFAIPDMMKQEFEPVPGITENQYRKYLEKKGIALDSKDNELEYQIPEACENGDLKWTDQFGFHYLTAGHLSKWLDQNPEYKSVIKLQ